MIAEARSGQKATNVRVIFDCGDDPGLALSALRHGLKTILIDAPRETFDKIADIAAQTDARVETAQPDGTKTLDLLDLDDAQDAITTWLSGD